MNSDFFFSFWETCVIRITRSLNGDLAVFLVIIIQDNKLPFLCIILLDGVQGYEKNPPWSGLTVKWFSKSRQGEWEYTSTGWMH